MSSAFLRRLPGSIPIVWTLHDMNAFTGGCHYAVECARFLETCGCCPQLGSVSATDITAKAHARRAGSYACLRADTTRFVTPSRWLASEAQRSSLLRDLQVSVIPNSVDLDLFTPRSREAARLRFQLPARGPVIAFVADHLGLHLKGLDLLHQALDGLAGTENVTVAVIGSKPEGGEILPGLTWLGRIDDEVSMSFALSAADVFVAPSRADNLPNVLLEAIACGTPVASFRTGGIPDVIRDGETGYLAAPNDVIGLRAAIEAVLADAQSGASLRARCRSVAERDYGFDLQASQYTALYGELIDASAARAHGAT